MSLGRPSSWERWILSGKNRSNLIPGIKSALEKGERGRKALDSQPSPQAVFLADKFHAEIT